MGTITYSNNVKVITGTHRTSTGVDWAYRAIVIPAEAIFKAVFYRPSATTVENIEGDIVFNWSPFTASGPRFGLRINNVTIKPWSTEAMPFPWWTSDNRAFINHPQAIFNAALNAAQGFRYLIENGVRNVNPSADWSFRAARRLIAANAEGDTILVSVKGISGQEQGLTLYECCDLLFSLGLGVTTAADGDSGGSTQDYIKIDGVKQVFRGDASAVINVPVYGVIKLTSPTTGGTIPEPPPDEPPPPPPPPVMTSHNMIADFDAEGNVTEVFVDGVKFVRP